METFRKETRGGATNLMTKELADLDSAKVQTTTWIRFKVEVEDGDVIRIDTIDKAFSSQMMEVFKGSDLNEIIEEMFAHIRRKSKSGVGEQPICVRSSPVSDVNFHQLNLI